jgi:sugar-phosphatase
MDGPTQRPGVWWCRAVVFDLDGLLVDSEPLWRRAQITVLGRHGVTLTDAQCRSTKGRAVTEVTQHWYERVGWRGPSPAAVAEEIVDEVVRLVAREAEPLPGALEAVTWCRSQGFGLAVASSSHRRVIAGALGRVGLDRAFDVVRSAEDVPAGKPDPAVYLAAAAGLEVAPARCLALEDSALGARAAVAAGMGCAVVPERAGAGAVPGEAGAGAVPRGAGAGTAPAAVVFGGVPVDMVLGSLRHLPARFAAIETAWARRRARGAAGRS